MKEMVYIPDHGHTDVLCQGKYRGISFCIVNRGTHPCAYVALPKKFFGAVSDVCHGGCTYNGIGIPGIEGSNIRYWLGWDYAHYGDYCAGLFTFNPAYERKWTTQEILDEVHEVIEKVVSKNENP